jgi:universal stress protein A
MMIQVNEVLRPTPPCTQLFAARFVLYGRPKFGWWTDMGAYRRILLAVDLTEESHRVAARALAIAKGTDAELHIIHVIEPLSLAYGGDIPMDLSSVQEQIHAQAKSHLAEFATSIGVAPDHRYLIFGRPEAEIHRVAKEKGADLVVVGSHGRHGLALLLGSTANGVLHGSPTDVLAVRVGTDAPEA